MTGSGSVITQDVGARRPGPEPRATRVDKAGLGDQVPAMKAARRAKKDSK